MSQTSVRLSSLVLRSAVDADIALLEALPFSGGLPGKHRQRLERQARGEVRYLLAVDEGRIIGHLLLKWDCPEESQVRTLIPSCAEIEDFVVEPALTGQGVGSTMLEHAADLSHEHSETRLGLAVGNENSHAWGLYERREFALVPGSAHRVTWLAREVSGREIEQLEDCVYLIRELA